MLKDNRISFLRMTGNRIKVNGEVFDLDDIYRQVHLDTSLTWAVHQRHLFLGLLRNELDLYYRDGNWRSLVAIVFDLQELRRQGIECPEIPRWVAEGVANG